MRTSQSRHSTWMWSKWVLIALLLCAMPAQAQTQPATLPATPGKMLFWKATKEGKTVYLLGSIHAADKSMYPLPPEMEKDFDDSAALLVEADVNNIDMGAMMTLVQEKGMYADGDTLSKHLDAKTMKEVTNTADKLGLPAAALEQMRPWMVEITLAALMAQDAKLDTNLGIDKHFLDEAGKQKKKVVELESADFQIKLMAGLPEAEIIKSLGTSMDDLKDMKGMLDDLIKAWKAGDVARTADLMNKGLDEPQTKKALLDDRNVEMDKGIGKAGKNADVIFVVVGAGHMVGEKGLVKLMEGEGYKVEQVTVTKKGE